MRKQVAGRSRATLSPIMDESNESEPKPWAITQQHGKTMNKSQSRLESRVKQDTKQRQGEGKGKKSGESNKITLPVLGSLSMNIEAHNPYETEKKSNHEALYKSRLLRTKKQKSIEGMFQAAKANKELSQILLNMNPSFNLDIEEHNLHRFLAPNRHLVPEDVEEEEVERSTELEVPSQDHTDLVAADDVTRSDDVTEVYDVTLPPLPASMPLEDLEEDYPLMGVKPPGPPPPLTSHELVRRSKVIEAVAPSTLWVPANSLQGGELVS